MDRLHANLQQVLQTSGWTGLTEAQQAAFPEIQSGQHVLLVAPTGHGKTEAALLPILDRLLRERDHLDVQGAPWPPGFKVLYVTPLRALNRDLQQRLASWCEELGITLGVRHGDTSQAERARQARKPPDILITTPETVQLLLYGDKLRAHLRTLRFVVVDEVHDLAASERGAQLMVALERIQEAIAQTDALRLVPAKERLCPAAPTDAPAKFQRIGLSATVADPAAVAHFLAAGAQPVLVAAPKKRTLTVVTPDITEEIEADAARLALPPMAMAQLRCVRALVRQHKRVLVFQNTRDGAEVFCNRSAALDEDEGQAPLLGLHHGSLSAEHRMAVEDDFKAGRLRGLVATSSLELGIDVGAIDHVIQVHSPRSVARLTQRLGRAGHRPGAESTGTLVASSIEDAWECQAIADAAMHGALEPSVLRDAPLNVVANQLIALCNEYKALQPSWAYQVIRRATPFANLDEGMFEAVVSALIENKTVFEDDEHPGCLARGGRVRRHFLENVSLIPDQVTYRVLDEASKRSIGSVDEEFVAAGLPPGTGFIMAGRGWHVLEMDPEHQTIRVAPSKELGFAPRWQGSGLPVTQQVARAVAKLRPSDQAMQRQHAQQQLAIPSLDAVIMETGRNTLVVHVALGTKGNHALGRITHTLLEQRIGRSIGMETDAYRIRFTGPVKPDDVEATWDGLDADSIEILLGVIVQQSGAAQPTLVRVAKQFGALPKKMDPRRITRKTLDRLWDNPAMQEEALAVMFHDQFDLPAVAQFLENRPPTVVQALGPVSAMGQDHLKMAAPRNDEALLAQVRRRLEQSDVAVTCTQCAHQWVALAGAVDPPFRCRRCKGTMAALRPWDEERLPWITRPPAQLDPDAKKWVARARRNADLLQTYGPIAAVVLCGRGVGADTAGRILQKVRDPDNPNLWREVLQAELDFARTSAFW